MLWCPALGRVTGSKQPIGRFAFTLSSQVWVTAMRQHLKAATFFWPGSDVAIKGTYPTFYRAYDK